MARQIERLYRLTGTLRADTALSIAHGDEGIIDDLVCIRDGRGRLVIPGSALAGVLRHRLGSNSLWGDDHDPGSAEPCHGYVPGPCLWKHTGLGLVAGQ